MRYKNINNWEYNMECNLYKQSFNPILPTASHPRSHDLLEEECRRLLAEN